MEHVGLKTVTTTSNYKLSVCAELTRYPIDVLFHWLDRNTIKVIQGGSVNRSSINGPGVNRHPVHILQQSSISIVPYWSPVNVLCRLSLATQTQESGSSDSGVGGVESTVTDIIMVKYCCFMYLLNDDRGFLLCSDVDEPQEDVLQLDEEGVGVHGPVLPGPETRHDSLLPQGGEVEGRWSDLRSPTNK